MDGSNLCYLHVIVLKRLQLPLKISRRPVYWLLVPWIHSASKFIIELRNLALNTALCDWTLTPDFAKPSNRILNMGAKSCVQNLLRRHRYRRYRPPLTETGWSTGKRSLTSLCQENNVHLNVILGYRKWQRWKKAIIYINKPIAEGAISFSLFLVHIIEYPSGLIRPGKDPDHIWVWSETVHGSCFHIIQSVMPTWPHPATNTQYNV